MGELLEPAGESAPDAGPSSDGAAAAAVGLALERAKGRRGGKADNVADRFLARQEELVAKQLHHLDEQFRHLRLRHFSERLKVTLQLLTIGVGLLIVAAVGWMAWDAAHADGLVVEAFSVPPELAAQGSTGPVVAREVLDSLRDLDRGANSLIDVKTSDAFTQGAKIDLPETGLTLAEVQKALRDWLGHETHVSGEVLKTAAGLKVIARTDAGETATAEGAEADLATLTAQVAEQIMAKARPNTVAEYYWRKGRLDDARRLLNESLATSSDPQQLSLAEGLLGNIDTAQADFRGAIPHYRAAMASPNVHLAAIEAGNLSSAEDVLGHTAASRAATERELEFLSKVPRTAQNGARLDVTRAGALFGLHDFKAAADLLRPIVRRRIVARTGDQHIDYGLALAFLHDPAARQFIDRPLTRADAALEDWAAVVRNWPANAKIGSALGQAAPQAGLMEALAHVGRFAEADAIARTLPPDCSVCYGERGVVAALEGDPVRSEREFAVSLRLDPNEPMILERRARIRLARGETERARADFEAANATAPHWADALEGWAEALLAKGDAPGAAAKFAQAAPLAPRWGRLRLKWGEALARQGKAADARAHLRAAASLNLTPEERAELAQQKVPA